MPKQQYLPAISEKPGRVFPLIQGMTGAAHFEDQDRRRIWLSRHWHKTKHSYWLWIGMNPSKAGGNADDPTVHKELGITLRERGRGYVKCNVMDWIATKPRDLLDICMCSSPANIPCIIGYARGAERVICAWGNLPPKFQPHAQAVLEGLANMKIPLWCLGTNQNGSPKHPLYLANDTPLHRYYP